jgi:rhodanese-related sulfurtransferase
MSPEGFADEFRFPRPDRTTDTLLFYCRFNTRSSMAAAFSRSIGYRALVYSGGWEEWKQHHKQ